jgi:protein-L-isoaspartate(D-aspartate) O-methyltransferase
MGRVTTPRVLLRVAECEVMGTHPDRLAERRAAYARAVVSRHGGHDARVEAAFAKVPREAFLGPPPWFAGGAPDGPWSETSDPAVLYQDRLVALDRLRGINNGQPSLHAMCMEALRLTPADRVLHVGAGTGYYTAILTELSGSVEAYEIEPALATRATTNLAPWPNASVHQATATGRKLPEADAIYVSAGACYPDPFWLDALRDGGRLIFPLTANTNAGGMLLVERRGPAFAARFLGSVSFIPCAGARDPVTAARLSAAFEGGRQELVRSLTREPAEGATVWFAGDGWYLSTEPPPGEDGGRR